MKTTLFAMLVVMLTSPNLQAQNIASTTTVAPTTDLLASQPIGGSQYLVVNFLDIVPFTELLSNSGFQAEADINESGAVDFLDIVPFIAILSAT